LCFSERPGRLEVVAAKKGGRGGARPGSGRPRILEDPVSYRLDLERDDYDALRLMAQETGTSAQGIVRQAITAYLIPYFEKRRRQKRRRGRKTT